MPFNKARGHMAYDLRQYLADQSRALDAAQNRGVEKWVETAHADIVRSALYSSFSEDGEWIVDLVPVPVLIGQYPGKRIGVELLRRRFVMDGWVRAEVLVQKEVTHVRLALAGPRDPLIVETVAFGEVVPENQRAGNNRGRDPTVRPNWCRVLSNDVGSCCCAPAGYPANLPAVCRCGLRADSQGENNSGQVVNPASLLLQEQVS